MSEALSHDDFTSEESKLQLLRNGPFAVLFMSKGDQNSMSLVKILKTIQVAGMQTGYLDISQGKNKDVITMSRKTNTQITAVPYLAIFYDQKMKFRYKGEVNMEKIRNYCQTKVIELSTSEIKKPSESSQKPISSSTSQQFSMATNNNNKKDTKEGIDPSKVGIIGFNKAHLIDMMHH